MRYTAALLGVTMLVVAGGARAQTASTARVERRAERAVAVGSATDVDRAQIEREIKELRGRLGEAAERFMQPAASDFARYSRFLKQPDTGLIRLLPRETYDYVIPVRGGGAYYSFTRRTHEYGYGSDLSLEQKTFSVGFAGADFGFITVLGDVNLEDVTLDTPGVRYLAAFETPLEEPEARAQHRRGWYNGFEVDGFTYTNRTPAVADRTYALRSINYSTSDVLVLFRVVREDADGSRVLLWRLLKEFPKPELMRADER